MKFHQLRDVIAVADHGSLRAASRHLNIAQSSISKSVQFVEKELKVPLFERQRRGSQLTPMGKLFVRRARAAIGELSRAQDEISQHRGADTGRVVAALSLVPHLVILPDVIGPFAKRYPNVQLTVLEAFAWSNVEEQIRDGIIDCYVGVATATELSAEFQIEVLCENERYVVARPGHPLARATSLRALCDASWVAPNPLKTSGEFDALFHQHDCPVPSRVTFSGGIMSQLVFVMNSDMLAVIPRQLVGLVPMHNLIVRIPIQEAINAPSILMVRRAAMPLTPAAEHFCDLVRRASVALGPVDVPTTRKPKKTPAPARTVRG